MKRLLLVILVAFSWVFLGCVSCPDSVVNPVGICQQVGP